MNITYNFTPVQKQLIQETEIMLAQDVAENIRCHGCGTHKEELKPSLRKPNRVTCSACQEVAVMHKMDMVSYEEMQKIIMERRRKLLSEEVGFEVAMRYAHEATQSVNERRRSA